MTQSTFLRNQKVEVSPWISKSRLKLGWTVDETPGNTESKWAMNEQNTGCLSCRVGGVYYQVSDHNESHEKMDASGFQPVLYGMEVQSLKTHCSLARWYLLNLLIFFTWNLLDFRKFEICQIRFLETPAPCLRRLGTPFLKTRLGPEICLSFPNFSNGRRPRQKKRASKRCWSQLSTTFDGGN